MTYFKLYSPPLLKKLAAVRKKRNSIAKGKITKVLILAGVVLLLIAGIRMYVVYRDIYGPNVHIEKEKEQVHLYIPTGSGFEEVVKLLNAQQIIRDSGSFIWLARKTGYTKKVYPGHYLIGNKMSNRELVNMLKSGRQTPVKVRFQNIRTRNQLAGILSHQIEADSSSILGYLNDNSAMARFGFTAENAMAMFIPNTY